MADARIPVERAKAPLKGLRQVVVLVQESNDPAIDVDPLRQTVLEGLRPIDLQVLPVEDVASTTILAIVVNTKRHDSRVAYVASLEILEWIDLPRAGTGRLSASVWREEAIGMTDTKSLVRDVEGDVRQVVEQFVAAYRAAR